MGGAGEVGGHTNARLAVFNLMPVYWRSGTVFLCTIFVPQQVVQSSGKLTKKPKVERRSVLEGTTVANQLKAGANMPNGGADVSWRVFALCAKLPDLHDQSGARFCCTWVGFAPGFPATHIFCRLSVFPLNITDRGVTSSRL